eukprot:3486460-Prymnesium_polylepis.1
MRFSYRSVENTCFPASGASSRAASEWQDDRHILLDHLSKLPPKCDQLLPNHRGMLAVACCLGQGTVT